MQKILIFGGAGFLGSHLADSFVETDSVICVDNFMTGNLWNIRHLLDRKNFKLVKGDIRDKPFMMEITKGVDIIFLLAALIHVDRSYIEPELTFDINVRGTQNVLEASKRNDVPKIVFASTSEVYGTAETIPMTENHPLLGTHPYAASKISADRMCYSYAKTFGMDITITRCFNFFGPRQRDSGYGGVLAIFARRLLNGMPPLIYGNGSQE